MTGEGLDPWGRSALITGASSGIGEAFARAFAARSVDLLLTALPQDEGRLAAIAAELSASHHVRVLFTTVDLAGPDAAATLQATADALGFDPDTIVNSAGFGTIGAFGAVPLDRQRAMIRVNVDALVALSGLYLPRLAARGRGAIVNVASTAALAPVPYFAVYAASKAFVVSFSQALWAEYRRHGVRVVAVCPGPVATNFAATATGEVPRRQLSVDAVVNAALDALQRDRPVVVQRVPVFGLLFALLSSSLVPRRLRLLLSERLARRFFRQGEGSDQRRRA